MSGPEEKGIEFDVDPREVAQREHNPSATPESRRMQLREDGHLHAIETVSHDRMRETGRGVIDDLKLEDEKMNEKMNEKSTRAPSVGAPENAEAKSTTGQVEAVGLAVGPQEPAMSEIGGADILNSTMPQPSSSQLLDLADLRLSQDFAQVCGVEELLTAVRVGKPHPQEFIRVHPGDDFRLQTQVLELKATREFHIVASRLWGNLEGEAGFGPRLLVTCVTRQGALFVWPLRLPRDGGRSDNWAASALTAAKDAESSWVRVSADMTVGSYRAFRAQGELPDPVWPERSFAEIISEAFKGRHIQHIDHPVLQLLRGEV